MTDNEIIEALECCSLMQGECKECPCDSVMDCDCEEMLLREAFYLIKRQKAEVERLSVKEKTLKAIINHYERQLKSAKSEAYKEFREMLKTVYGEFDWEMKTCIYTDDDIDNTLKELTESKNDFEG